MEACYSLLPHQFLGFYYKNHLFPIYSVSKPKKVYLSIFNMSILFTFLSHLHLNKFNPVIQIWVQCKVHPERESYSPNSTLSSTRVLNLNYIQSGSYWNACAEHHITVIEFRFNYGTIYHRHYSCFKDLD